MMYRVVESDSGDELGIINAGDARDEDLVELLCATGYLDLAPDNYILTDSYEFADSHSVVTDADTGDPLLILEPDEDLVSDADDDDLETDDQEDEDDESA